MKKTLHYMSKVFGVYVTNLLLISVVLFQSTSSIAQPYYTVNHYSGSAVYNGTGVGLTFGGAATTMPFCFGDATPYYFDQPDSGSVTFTFSSPARSVRLASQFGGGTDGYYSYAINGVQYPLSASNLLGAGLSSCSYGLASLSGGNLQCTSNQLSGDIEINGVINSVTVTGHQQISQVFLFGLRFAMPLHYDSTSPYTFNICRDAAATSIRPLLSASDGEANYVWGINSAPSHGILSGFPVGGTLGSNVLPSGTTYTPTPGYSGPDAFTIDVTDGITTRSMVVNVIVNLTVTNGSITGNTTICGTGNTTTLSNATAGGVWQNGGPWPAIAVGSASGIVTGVSSGTGVVTYNAPGGCGGAVQTITVSALPAAITGTATLCAGNSTQLTDATASGTWSSSATAVATVGASSGLVIGNTSGTATISYRSSTTCAVSQVVTVSSVIPSVTSVSALTAIPGTTVTLTGTNFNTTTSNNIVYFGATRASVNSATATSLNVTVPGGATYLPLITVENTACAQTGYAPLPFLPTYNNTGFVANTVNFATKVDFATGVFPNRITYGDLDGDGKTDMVTNNNIDGTLGIYLNTSSSGSVSFATPTLITTPGTPGQPTLGDIDGDGKPDIISTSSTGSNTSIYRNTSTGTGNISFASPVSYSGGINASTIRDIDGDGKADMITGTGATISIYRNISSPGTISFLSPVSVTSNGGTINVSAGDMDGDGKADILVCGNAANLSVFKNTSSAGAISFATRQDIATASIGAFAISYGDLDGDGKEDMYTSNVGVASFSVFPGTSTLGTISFGTRQDYTVGNNPNNISAGDFNGDGLADIAVAANSGNIVSVFMNTSTSGSITFAGKVDFSLGYGVTGLVATDIDMDGKMDLAGTSQAANKLFVLRNNPLRPITGTGVMCATFTASLSDATSGGAWSSSATTTATVNSSGLVTGQSAGTATISYAGTAGASFAGNAATTTVTVNSLPATITGATAGPVGASSLLSDATAGGTWSSGNTLVATVGSASGNVIGVAAGTAAITYKLTTGCIITSTVTINTLPTTWYSVTTGGDAASTNSWWQNNNNTGFQPLAFSTAGTNWIFQSVMTATTPLTIKGDVTISSGASFTPFSASTTTIGGSWNNAGSFVHNSGTMIFDGSNGGAGKTLSGAMTGTNAFNNLTFNSSSLSYSFGNNAVDVKGTFTQQSGTVTGSSANMNLTGNFSKTGGSFAPNGGTVTLVGTSSGISATGMTTATTDCFNNLSFNAATSSIYTISSSLRLMGNFNNMTANGTVALGTNTLTIGGNWNNAGPFTTGASNVVMNGTGTFTMTGKR